MDGKKAVDSILDVEDDRGVDGNLVEEIKLLKNCFRSFACQWQPRAANMAAYSVTQFALRCKEIMAWIEEAPPWLMAILEVESEDCYTRWGVFEVFVCHCFIFQSIYPKCVMLY
ncbi:hypothetical protein C1H46_036222 [Malus baccata]|uniref:RNase H type-1 domain-containing protein n=1 Tax=Malus baccata TaxID=106549 RepID=A0A540KVG4_MALBA|nr:hypothetical protein C1H46_036222 [Malus baccata]